MFFLIVFLTKVNLQYLLFSIGLRCCLLHLIKQNCLLKTFLRTLHDSELIPLPAFPSRTHLKLHNTSVTPKMIKKVIMNLDLSKASGTDCIPVVVLKNCEPELSYILAELFNSVLSSLVFQIVGRFHQWSLYLRMLGRVLQLKTTIL